MLDWVEERQGSEASSLLFFIFLVQLSLSVPVWVCFCVPPCVCDHFFFLENKKQLTISCLALLSVCTFCLLSLSISSWILYISPKQQISPDRHKCESTKECLNKIIQRDSQQRDNSQSHATFVGQKEMVQKEFKSFCFAAESKLSITKVHNEAHGYN